MLIEGNTSVTKSQKYYIGMQTAVIGILAENDDG